MTPLALTLTVALGTDAVAYVNASQLKVRETPTMGAKVLVRLPMNAEVRVLAADAGTAGWLQVELGDGRKGFVASSMLAARRIDAPGALAEAKAVTNVAQRIAWLERAAAIDPTREVLVALAAAVREAGDEKRAKILESRLPWPDDLFVSPDFVASPVSIEWRGPLPPGLVADPASGAPLTTAQLDELSLKTSDTWWVLPERGPAVKAKLKGAVYLNLNECGGTFGVWVTLDANLPAGERPVAAARRADAPRGWKTAVPAVDLAAAKTLANVELARLGAPMKSVQLRVAASADGSALARAWWMPRAEEKKEWFEQRHEVVDLRIAGGKATVTRRSRGSFMPPYAPVVHRDIDGDGRLDLVLNDTCSGRIVDETASPELDGPNASVRTETQSRCCGC